MPELILALDVGTTSARAAVFGPDGTIAGIAAVLVRRVVRLRHPLAGHAASLAACCLLGAALVVAVRSLRVI